MSKEIKRARVLFKIKDILEKSYCEGNKARFFKYASIGNDIFRDSGKGYAVMHEEKLWGKMSEIMSNGGFKSGL